MPSAAAKALAAKKPVFRVAATHQPLEEPPTEPTDVGTMVFEPGVRAMLCVGVSGEQLLVWPALDGAVDFLQACVDGTFAAPLAGQFEEAVQSLLASVGDGGDFGAQVEQCVRAWPHSGRARALAVLCQWWCKGDLEQAQKAIDDGTKALATEAVPMSLFADLVLRGDRSEPKIAKTLAVVLAPVAAAAPAGVFTQLVYLRALLRAGQDRLAGRVVATLQKHLSRPGEQLVFAETLMEGGTPAVFRDLAMKAIDAVKTAGGDVRLCYAARHKVLVRCGELDAAAKLMVEYRGSVSADLNNDAWYMIVRPDTMGRYDTLALAQCEELQRQEGANLSFGNKDTVALAHFVNGKVEQAVELQTEATRASSQNPLYVGRLTRFQAVLDEQGKRKGSDPKK